MVVGTTTGIVLSVLQVCLSLAWLQCHIMKLYRRVFEIKMKKEFEDGCGWSKGVGSRGQEEGFASKKIQFF